jgi:hypothetical protein
MRSVILWAVMRPSRDGLPLGQPSVSCLLAALALAASCKPHFTGPYPCETGYASCVNPEANQCETDVETDGLNCGQCGKVCALGAPCAAGGCGQGAQTIATLSSGGYVRTNATNVFWSDARNIYALPMSAPAGVTPTTVTSNAVMCNNAGSPFAVDDANLYFLAADNSCGSANGTCQGLTQISLSTLTSTLLVPSPSSQSGGVNTNVCGSLAVSAGSVYVLTSQQSGNVATYSIGRASVGVAGQTLSMLGSVPSYNGSFSSPLVVNSTDVLFETQGADGSQVFQLIPVDGGPAATLPLPVNGYGSTAPFVADDANIYVVGGGCPCNNNGNSSTQGPPQGVLARVPLHGGPSAQLAAFSGVVGGVATDGTNVYWSTDTSAWKAPLAGGAATVVAGNLTNGSPGYQCNGCGGGNSVQPTAIAVGSSALYIAIPAPSSALLEVTK